MILVIIAITLSFVVIVEPALAHSPPFGMTGFWGGMLHPWFVTAHFMAVVGLGLLLGSQERGRAGAIAAFVLALAAGFAAMMAGMVPRWTNEATFMSAILTGLWAAVGKPVPGPFFAGLAGVLGLAVALDSPPDTISIGVANWTLAGTGIGAAILLLAVTKAVRWFSAKWMHIAVRVIGAWIATAAILSLAMQWFRN